MLLNTIPNSFNDNGLSYLPVGLLNFFSFSSLPLLIFFPPLSSSLFIFVADLLGTRLSAI